LLFFFQMDIGILQQKINCCDNRSSRING